MLHVTPPPLCLEPLEDLPVPLQEHTLLSFIAFHLPHPYLYTQLLSHPEVLAVALLFTCALAAPHTWNAFSVLSHHMTYHV